MFLRLGINQAIHSLPGSNCPYRCSQDSFRADLTEDCKPVPGLPRVFLGYLPQMLRSLLASGDSEYSGWSWFACNTPVAFDICLRAKICVVCLDFMCPVPLRNI